MFSSPLGQSSASSDRTLARLDRFARDHEQQLAALSWAWFQGQDPIAPQQEVIGIDLLPTPRFVGCPYEAVQNLNRNVDGRLQEVLGLIEHYKINQEVLMLAIADGQIKLIYFQPQTPPPECFETLNQPPEQLLTSLETHLAELFPETSSP